MASTARRRSSLSVCRAARPAFVPRSSPRSRCRTHHPRFRGSGQGRLAVDPILANPALDAGRRDLERGSEVPHRVARADLFDHHRPELRRVGLWHGVLLRVQSPLSQAGARTWGTDQVELLTAVSSRLPVRTAAECHPSEHRRLSLVRGWSPRALSRALCVQPSGSGAGLGRGGLGGSGGSGPRPGSPMARSVCPALAPPAPL